MTAFSSRARLALAASIALIVLGGAALIVHQPEPHQTVRAAGAAPTGVSPTTADPTTTTTTTQPPTTTTAPTPAATSTTTTHRTPAATTTSTTVASRHRTPTTTPERKTVACQYIDQGNQLGQLQVLNLSAPDLANAKLGVAMYYPATSSTSKEFKWTQLDGNGAGSVTFQTTPDMVGNQIRLEGSEMKDGTYQASDVRHCPSTLFTVQPPS